MMQVTESLGGLVSQKEVEGPEPEGGKQEHWVDIQVTKPRKETWSNPLE